MKKFSEIDQCKSDIAKLEESLRQTTKKIPEIDMKKFSEIDQCKSDIATLKQTTKKFFEIDHKSDIAKLEESLRQTTKKIPEDAYRKITDLLRDVANLKTSRVLVSAFHSKTREIETAHKNLNGIVKHLAESDKTRLEETKTWVPMLVNHDKGLKEIQTKINSMNDTINHLGENDRERLEETNTWVPMLVNHDKGLKEIQTKINSMNDTINHLGENDRERLEETNTWVPMLVANSKDISELKTKVSQIFELDKDISDLKLKIQNVAPSPIQKFSLNSKGIFYHELKQTLFFSPGLILPDKIFVYSLYITASIKSQSKHNRKFEFMAVKNGSPESLYSFEREVSDEIIMEDFDPPIEIPSKTKVLLSCDRKLDGMAVLTVKY
jgi:myosin heavy subunit